MIGLFLLHVGMRTSCLLHFGFWALINIRWINSSWSPWLICYMDRLTVWVNGNKNSELVNVIPDSSLLFLRSRKPETLSTLPPPSKIPSPLAPKEGLITVVNGGNLGTSWTQYPSKNPIEASKKKRPSKLDRLKVLAEKTSHFL